MSRTVTLRLDMDIYNRFKALAEEDNRPLSNFIETAALRYVEENTFVDEFELTEILANTDLNKSMKQGIKDATAGRGRFV
ncbi:MAG: CopG family transcriptional regulator [Bacteroidetes bacterium CG12_big_fil_rev_8_21_14_0_65_60_17]|nr:MAG: CopG family transcriptional regulator [Bacteroidetes bacterium CG12_big_fil_rev_8_21_14_0_65_60_17]